MNDPNDPVRLPRRSLDLAARAISAATRLRFASSKGDESGFRAAWLDVCAALDALGSAMRGQAAAYPLNHSSAVVEIAETVGYVIAFLDCCNGKCRLCWADSGVLDSPGKAYVKSQLGARKDVAVWATRAEAEAAAKEYARWFRERARIVLVRRWVSVASVGDCVTMVWSPNVRVRPQSVPR